MSKQDLDDPDVGIIAQDVISLDLGYGAVPPDYNNMSSGYGADTITISNPADSIDLSSINLNTVNTITLPSSSNTFTYSGATVGGITTINNISNNSHWTTGTSGYQFNTTTPNTVHINNNGIEMAAGTDIKVDGKSLKEFMNKMEERLAILVPDPKKLEQFAALKKAYEHYKLMEKLCQEPPKEEE
jgi:hypothetical protein